MYEELITVVDNFFTHPLKLRNQALSLTYTTPVSQLEPNAVGPIAEQTPCPPDVMKTALSILSPIISNVSNNIKNGWIEYRYVHAKTIKKTICHADMTDLAGVVYLTLPEHCQGGTVFFRHKPTGDYWFHPEREHLYFFDKEGDWEETYRSEMLFNRLVFYPGCLFHAIGTPYFGDTIQNSRLTLTLFLNVRDKRILHNQFQKIEAELT